MVHSVISSIMMCYLECAVAQCVISSVMMYILLGMCGGTVCDL